MLNNFFRSPAGAHGGSPGLPARSVLPETTGASFDPEAYKTAARLVQQKSGREILAQHGFASNAVVLDIGMGDGLLSSIISAEYAPKGQVVGVDISSDMVATARRDYPIEKFPNLEFIEGDATKIAEVLQGYEQHHRKLIQFTDVISTFALHWLETVDAHRDFLLGLRPNITVDAKLSFAFSDNDSFPDLFRAAEMTVAKSEWANHFDNGKFRHPEFVTCDQYKQLILKTGYEGTVDRQDSWWRFENRSQLALWFEASIRPFMERLKNESPEVRKKFACEVIDNYMAKIASISDYPKFDGDEVFLRGPLIVVHASPKIYRDTAAITF